MRNTGPGFVVLSHHSLFTMKIVQVYTDKEQGLKENKAYEIHRHFNKPVCFTRTGIRKISITMIDI